MKVLITGSEGFIGEKLSNLLVKEGVSVVRCVRSIKKNKPMQNLIIVGDIGLFNSWQIALKGVDVVIHLAAIAHNFKDNLSSERIKLVNTDATLRLGSASVKSGVKKFIYLSSIGVLGNSTKTSPFDNKSEYNPQDLYAVSKMEAEIGLKKIFNKTSSELVIVRPPMVYGAQAPGNFYRLLRLVDSGIPLPLAAMNEKKSMISLDNLCDFLVKIIYQKKPVCETELVISDDSYWSTSELIAIMYDNLQRRRMIFYLPIIFLNILSFFLGKNLEFRKMMSPLEINDKSTREIIDWSPIDSPEVSIKKAIIDFVKNK